MIFYPRQLFYWFSIALFCLGMLWPMHHPAAADDTKRIIAIADIHGEYDGFRELLQHLGLIDRRDRWSGGETTLVQTGDFLDRGAGAIPVARMLKRLQEEAPQQGGQVVVLLGNHEVLNMIGDLRYITKEILTPLIDERSEARLEAFCSDYSKFVRRRAVGQRNKPPKNRDIIRQCEANQAAGLMEYIDWIGPEADLGKWLRALPTVVKIDDVVFLHGGISPVLQGVPLDEINRRVTQELADFDQIRSLLAQRRLILPTTNFKDIIKVARQLRAQLEAQKLAGERNGEPISSRDKRLLKTASLLDNMEEWYIFSNDGPLWFRGYAEWSDAQGEAQLPQILQPLEAQHLVVGHTPQEESSIVTRFDQRVFLIDTGMLMAYYKGRPSALEIQAGTFKAIYLDEEISLQEAAGPTTESLGTER